MTRHNRTYPDISVNQVRVIHALLQSGSIKTACKSARVARSTFYEWMQQEGFRQALRSAEQELIADESRALLAVMEACRMVLFRLATTAESENQRRLSALNLYELALRMREGFELEERISTLERLQDEREEKGKRFGRC